VVAQRRWPAFLAAGAVPRLRHDDPAVLERLRQRLPVIATGSPLVAGVVGKWSFDHFGSRCGAANLHVHVAPATSRLFPRAYGENIAKGAIMEMPFTRFTEESRKPNRKNVMCVPPLATR